ncbi:hypothetical protein GCM10011344_29940 [Dokdonia pacifica]|uniref:RNA polymerase sigma factor, sigma-70 family n=1 Tax=Dokdonia pacifica TaxID=1627892 RepID=A0A239C0L8_9FLAO|nr:sigma-70 family RNA polymerase sigma factor [Dokdonia pacifica]GGG27179.1 hypothetical protein GCM10011344_29940 [Dokdonia pacifica]SNS13469.1 RNA polymerase sigma factor, sigma-70 family [Dokdonia pacifica]
MLSSTQPKDDYQQDIIQAIKENDAKVFERLYVENFPKIASYIRKNNGNTTKAKDIFQEAMIALWKAVKTEKFTATNPTAIQGYLYTIAKNKWTDYLRSSTYKKESSTSIVMTNVSDDDVSIDDEEIYESQLKKAKDAFAQLGDDCRKLLSRFYFKRQSLQDIAIDVGLDAASVRNKKYRCMQRLRALAIPQKSEL